MKETNEVIEDEVVYCPVCTYAGTAVSDDRGVRIWHERRIWPCRAPAGYDAQRMVDALLAQLEIKE